MIYALARLYDFPIASRLDLTSGNYEMNRIYGAKAVRDIDDNKFNV